MERTASLVMAESEHDPKSANGRTLARKLDTKRGTGMPGAVLHSGGVRMDALYLGVTIVFFALSWGLIVLCEKL